MWQIVIRIYDQRLNEHKAELLFTQDMPKKDAINAALKIGKMASEICHAETVWAEEFFSFDDITDDAALAQHWREMWGKG